MVAKANMVESQMSQMFVVLYMFISMVWELKIKKGCVCVRRS